MNNFFDKVCRTKTQKRTFTKLSKIDIIIFKSDIFLKILLLDSTSFKAQIKQLNFQIIIYLLVNNVYYHLYEVV